MNPEQLLDRFSTHLKNVITKAMAMANSLQHPEVKTVHLLLLLAEENGSVAGEILHKYSFDHKYLYNYLDNLPKGIVSAEKAPSTVLPELSTTVRRALEKAMLLAYQRSHVHVGTEHLLLALLSINDKEIEDILKNIKINKKNIITEVENILQSTSNFPKMEDVSNLMNQIEDVLGSDSLPPPTPNNLTQMPRHKKLGVSAVELFTTNLTDKKIQKNIDPVVGREKEIDRIINILARRTKNNPVLVGEAGVGKTAIVEGLAKRIVQNSVPDVLKNKKVLSLDMTLLIAGTIYRGEFEARLKQVIDEVSKSTDYILFIDELHNIIGAGSSAGAMDAANILKPALARGLLHCIGATTIDEYKKHISNDPALERRFQAVNIEEPNNEETLAILEGLKKYYDDFHNTKITPEAIATAVNLSNRYVHDNFQPDKAIDLIDEACASVRVKQKMNPLQEKLNKLQTELKNKENEKEEAVANEKFEQAITLKKYLAELEKKITTTEKQLAKSKKSPAKKVLARDIAHILATKLNIPENILLTSEWEELDTLPKRLADHLIGQDQAIVAITKTLCQGTIGLKNEQKPLASLLFVGPPGTGKTEMAKVLAKELYHDEKALIRLDMSEFSEAHSTSKLLGSPAGYIGHKERNKFTDEIRRRPYCILLLDEIDKAHKDVSTLLLPMLDEGIITDSTGKKTSLKHAIIILTTNLGAELFNSSGIGFGQTDKTTSDRDKNVLAKLKEELSPALLNRLDKIIIFQNLSTETIQKIISKHLDTINERLTTQQKITLKSSPEAVKALATEIKKHHEGAREVERLVQDTIQSLIIEVLQKTKHKNNYQLIKQKEEYKLV